VSAYIPAELRRQIRINFSNRCAYCQTPEELTAVTFEIEHIIPRVAGGDTTAENLCLACPTCNRHKAHRQFFPDPVTDKEAVLFHPHQQSWK
jgi:5-methylcytosine-specific restriction endonuclease McrA